MTFILRKRPVVDCMELDVPNILPGTMQLHAPETGGFFVTYVEKVQDRAAPIVNEGEQ